MQSFILVGSTEKQQEYIDKFKKEQKVPGYLILSFDPFKILDARLLQKTISLKLKDTESRLIVICNPTIESQHAILKTIEELPDRNFVFFLTNTKENLLPTIQSRSLMVSLGASYKKIREGLEGKLNFFIEEESQRSVYGLMDFLGEDIELNDIEEIILGLRLKLLLNVSDEAKSIKILRILKALSKNYILAKNNNVNKKIVIEYSLLSNILPLDKNLLGLVR